MVRLRDSYRPGGRAVGLCALVLLAVGLRAWDLEWPLLWVDEAESAINALTIVADGVPGDHFLGQPLYENTLVRPWPESSEYEFRDISYSDRGLAVYHGWLPLYSIAAAFRLAGVTPEEARRGSPPRDATEAELRHWTAVPRWPAVVFSALFVLAAYGLGAAVHGPPVGWALAGAAAVSNAFVWFGRQARYYSAALALNAVCGLAIWNACRRGRVSDHALAGLAIGALFHTHSVSAITMAALYVAALPLARRQPHLWLRVLTAGTVAAVLVVPWAAWSGLLGHTAHVPAARRYVDLSVLLWSLPSRDPVMLTTAGLGLAWSLAVWLGGDRLRERWRQPVVDEGSGLCFALAWLGLSYAVFLALMPVASFYPDRLKLAVAVPGLLFNTLVVAAATRGAGYSSPLAPALGVIALLTFAGQFPPRLGRDSRDHGVADLVRLVRSLDLGPAGRLFASSNEHLTLTYYSGRPVQSIAPVRREWLDHFRADLVVVDGPWYETLLPGEADRTARRLGRQISSSEAEGRAADARRLTTALDLAASGAHLVPPPPPPDDLDRALVATLKAKTKGAMEHLVRGTPLTRFAAPSNWREWRHAFFYWLSDPDRRSGAGLNYRSCRDSARVHPHASGFVVFDCRRGGTIPLIPLIPDEPHPEPQP